MKNTNIFFEKICIISAITTVLALAVVLVGCLRDDKESTDSQIAYEQAYAIAYGYLLVDNNKYVLNLSEKKALSLGINKLEYSRIQAEINRVNAFVVEKIANGHNFTLADPKSVSASIVRLKNSGEIIFDDPCCGKFYYECACDNGRGGFCTCQTILYENPCGEGGWTCTGFMKPPCSN